MPGAAKDLLEIAGAFMESRILLSAAELDLFSKLQHGARHSDDIANKEGWDKRGLRILMDALVALNVLSKQPDGEYRAEQKVLDALAAGGPESVLPLVMHRARMWKSWSNITETIKTSENPRFKAGPDRTPQEIRDFIGAMHVIGGAIAGSVVKDVNMAGRKRLLDIGGGSGVYTIAFLRKNPNLKATIFDLPDVIEISKEWIAAEGLTDRVDFVGSDYTKDAFPEGHDAALLSAVIHSNSREQNRSIYARLAKAMEPKGLIIVRDHFMNETRTNPKAGAIFAVNMLAATRAGDTYTVAEVMEDLESSGFEKSKISKAGENMDQVITATKADK